MHTVSRGQMQMLIDWNSGPLQSGEPAPELAPSGGGAKVVRMPQQKVNVHSRKSLPTSAGRTRQ